MNINLASKILIVITIAQGCQSQQKERFDLFELDFSEKITDILTQQQIEISEGKSDAPTLFGYDKFQSNKSGLLRFRTEELSGNSNPHENHVIFHYDSENKTIAMYEVFLFTESEVTKVKGVLTSGIGKASHSSTNSNGIEMNVWKNDTKGVYYFLMSYDDDATNVRKTELTVINMKNTRAKEWISFRSFNYYL